jgi:hypothetical protein
MVTIVSTKKVLIILLFSFTTTLLHAWKKIEGNDASRGNTFTFPIKTNFVNRNNRLYVGAYKQDAAKEFSISYLERMDTAFIPLAPQTVTLDTIKDQTSPLYNAAIAHISEIDQKNKILVVTDSEPQSLYLINGLPSAPKKEEKQEQATTNADQSQKETSKKAPPKELKKEKEPEKEDQKKKPVPQQLFSLKKIYDASGKALNNGILALAGHNDMAFVVVKGNNQDHFGQGDSGIALVNFIELVKQVEVSPQEIEELHKKLQGADEDEINRQLGAIEETKGKGDQKEGAKFHRKVIERKFTHVATTAVNRGSPFLKIGADLAWIGDVVDIQWSTSLERLYISFRVRSGSQEGAGARAVAVGYFNYEGNFTLVPIIAQSMVGADRRSIVGGIGPEQSVSIHKIRTLQTATGFLDYLIVQGGNGEPKQTQKTIFALPALNYKNELGVIDPSLADFHGTLADVTEPPVEFFTRGTMKPFAARHFVMQPKDARSIYTQEDSPACVGAGPLMAPISDFVVNQDAVYAFVNESQDLAANGIYHSQAIFDYDGRIAAWTAWQKIADAGGAIHQALFDAQHATITLLAGLTADSANMVTRSQWQQVDTAIPNPLALLHAEFKQEDAGIQGLFEFKSFLCATGLDKVVLARPVEQIDHRKSIARCKNGSIDEKLDPSCAVVSMSGGALEKIGPVVAAQIITHEDSAWLAVGGVYGMAILCDENGHGWDKSGLGDGLSNRGAPLRFVAMGNYTFIKKLIFDAPYLYVLTDSQLDRIDMRSVDLCASQLNPTVIAHVHNISGQQTGIFHDMAISEKLGLLAHSAGLCRVGDGQDVRTGDADSLAWTDIALTTKKTPVIGLVCTSVNGASTDVARAAAGQLYVIAGSIDKDTSMVARFVIHSVLDKEISGATVQPLRDLGAQDALTSFIKCGTYISSFMTDGTLYFMATYKNMTDDLFYLDAADAKSTIHPTLYTGFGKSKSKVPIHFEKINAQHISCIMRSTLWGNILVAGDFGLLVNN